MDFERRNIEAKGIRISVTDNGVEVGRAYLYLMYNDLHEQPFGLMENVSHRGKGVGSKLVDQVVELAKGENCYNSIFKFAAREYGSHNGIRASALG